MAGMLEQWTDSLPHRNLRSPRTRPGGIVFNRKPILNRVGVGSREPLDDSQILAGTSQRVFAVEVRGLDNKRIAFPMSARIADPLPDISRDVRPIVERNHAHVMILFEQDHDV